MKGVATRLSVAYGIASGLFLLSGATGLIYEVIWFKRFSHVWGSSTLAMAAVVGSFLLGLGIGAHLWGRFADRCRVPLLWYGLCEIAIGVLALLIPFEIQVLRRAAAPVYAVFQYQPALYFTVRLLLTLVVIGPPCVLMGGTLPLLIKQFTPPGSALRRATGWLYAINTLGAAGGCYLAGFHLLPAIGLFWTNLLAVGLNLSIGLGAALVSRLVAAAARGAAGRPAAGPSDGRGGQAWSDEPSSRVEILWLYGAVCLSGTAALILQMAWARQLGLILGGSTYAFSAMLFVILVGIGLGSLAFRWWCAALPDTRVVLVALLAVLLVGGLAGQLLVELLTGLTGAVIMLRTSPWFNGVFCVVVSVLLELVPALGMGFLFPLFVDMTRRRAEDAGRTVGNVYAWNTAGTLAGATLTSSVLIPRFGLSGTIAIALGMYAVALLAVFPTRRGLDKLVQSAVLLLAAPLVLWAAVPHDPLVTNCGMYGVGYIPTEVMHSTTKLLRLAEGKTCSVMVSETKEGVSLRVAGKANASSMRDMPTQLALAYLPRFACPQARDIMVIGYGSGVTVGASLLFPDTKVVCCEIEEAVLQASEFFSQVNHRPERSPNYRAVIEDGRNYLQATGEKFDLVISQPSHPWMAGVASLFTEEFYEAVRARLNEGGVLAQWIQVYGFTPADYTMAVRTIRRVFPHCTIMQATPDDTILLASASPLEASQASAQAAQALVDGSRPAQADLARYLGSTDVRHLLLTHVVLGESGVEKLIEGDGSGSVNTDLNMRLEFDAARQQFAPAEEMVGLNRRLLGFTDPAWIAGQFKGWGCGREQLDALVELAGTYDKHGLTRTSLAIGDLALEVDPQHAFFLAERLRLAPPADPEAFRELVTKVAASDLRQAVQSGTLTFQGGQHQQALAILEHLSRLRPESATIWTNLALVYDALGQRDQADSALQEGLRRDPVNSNALRAQAAFAEKRR